MVRKHNRSSPIAWAVVVAAFGIAACGETPSGPDAASLISRAPSMTVSDGGLGDNWELWSSRAWLCKVGSAATFEVSVDGGPPVEHTLQDGECKVVHFNENPGGPEQFDFVTITELSSLSTVLDSIVQDSTHMETIVRLPTLTGTKTTTITTFPRKGGIAVFHNSVIPPPPPPPFGGEGCTPGFWKQAHHFDSWTAPLTPSTLFSDVFSDAFPGMTLLDVVSQGGGGLKALGRHTVAALLNSASADVDYDEATAAVIAAFNSAFAGGEYNAQKNLFEGLNEQGCPLS